MTSPNYGEISIVIFDEIGHLASIQKSILRGFGARKVTVVDTIETLHHELMFGRDIVLINWAAQSDDFVPLIQGIRQPQTSPDPYVGIILVAPVTSRRRVEVALGCGAHSLLGCPFRPVDFTQHIARLALNPGAFIETESYCGPDRRRKQAADYTAPERRNGAACRTISGVDLASERRRSRAARMATLEMVAS